MTGLLKDNVVAVGLLGLAGAVLLTALAMQLTADIDLDSAVTADPAISEEFVGGSYSLPGGLESYAAIDERPLFNTTRRPIAVDEFEVDGDVAGPDESSPLNAGLAGVIIVEDKMIVVLQDNETQQYVRTTVGEGMEGAFADWRVDEIGPRSVTLTSFDGESVQLDMQVAETTPAAPGVPDKQPGTNAETPLSAKDKYQQEIMNLGKNDSNESRAEEIRRRIAERRAQLQEAADKKAAQGNGNNDDDL
jgi:hypothetical protein